ncbi:ceramide synthase 6-like [Oppia nitens]|uniref:ceramide synthase 6-like n=1 Tax=Oppia nitens TaxID=1686743 RepID=UPI0023DBF56D|nr:ceramide synthase 6-like [Oppia nitens]
MSGTLTSVRQWFWSEPVWIPPNTTWSLYEDNYRHFNDIYYSLITAVFLIGIRFTLERYIYAPVGIYLGLRPTHGKSPPHNAILEQAFRASKGKLSHKQIQGLSKQLDWTERQVQRWVRLKTACNRPTVLSKFTESAWRCNFYFVSFVYGVYVLWDKPWMWDSMYCFIDYPHHSISSGEWFYYNFETAFYLALLFSQFIDVQRKDFWAMFIHHVVSLCLLGFSWACNLVRIGTLVLLIHDFADIPLEGAKMMVYVKKQRLADGIFVVFTVCWIVSRIGLLPYRILYYSLYKALDVVPMFAAYYIFNGLLCALQALHIVWTWFIVRIAIHAVNNNGIKDLRSDDESSEGSLKDSSDELLNGAIDGSNVLNKNYSNGGLKTVTNSSINLITNNHNKSQRRHSNDDNL